MKNKDPSWEFLSSRATGAHDRLASSIAETTGATLASVKKESEKRATKKRRRKKL
jgi:hypothetical protein